MVPSFDPTTTTTFVAVFLLRDNFVRANFGFWHLDVLKHHYA